MQDFFIFKGINSHTKGIHLIDLPMLYKPSRNVETISIPGRSGSLHVDSGTYNPYNIVINCSLSHLDPMHARTSELVTWLNGFGELILSSDLTKKYKASLNESFALAPILDVFTDFSLNFTVHPYKYSNSADKDVVTITKQMTLLNKGDLISLPIIKVFGKGNGSIFINGIEYRLTGITEFLVIDSELQNVYKGNENKNSSFLQFDFPTLDVGQNVISFSGGIKKLEIEPNWVWL